LKFTYNFKPQRSLEFKVNKVVEEKFELEIENDPFK